MHGSFHICDRCEIKFSYVAFSDWYYEIGGQQIHISTRPAWCFDCNKLRSAESLPTIEDCEQEAALLADEKTALGTLHAQPKALETAMLRLEWRTSRVSNPRCIGAAELVSNFLTRKLGTAYFRSFIQIAVVQYRLHLDSSGLLVQHFSPVKVFGSNRETDRTMRWTDVAGKAF